jgi:hypothetical protein
VIIAARLGAISEVTCPDNRDIRCKRFESFQIRRVLDQKSVGDWRALKATVSQPQIG